MNKKNLIFIIGIPVFLIFLSAILFITKGDKTSFSFDTSMNPQEETASDDFFSVTDESFTSQADITKLAFSQMSSLLSYPSKLDSFSRFYDYYIPSEMNYILAAYHYESINNSSILSYDKWSEELYENQFMMNNGQFLYPLFLLNSIGKTIQYGFITSNEVLLNSLRYENIYTKYLNPIYR